MTTHKKPIQRRDATGHLNPEYERRLMEESAENKTDDNNAVAFIDGTQSSEELAEELGETFVEAATTGEDTEGDRHDRVTPEEAGGPFVPSSGNQEFAGGTDDSNIPEATREPLPTTSKADV